MVLEDVFGHGAPLGAPPPDGSGPSPSPRGPQPSPVSADQRAVLGALEGETLTAEEVAERTGLGLGVTLAALTTLELDGAIRRGPGGLHGRV